MNQSNLSPKEQSTLFTLLKKAGEQPTSGGDSMDTPDVQAQQGVGNVDASGIQGLFPSGQGGQGQPSLQQQPGDRMHPMDAINHIAGQLQGPQAPAGVGLATGPMISRKSDGSLEYKEESSNPLLKLFGVKSKVDVNTPNYFQAAKAAGVDKFLPSELAQMPDGTPFVGPQALQHAIAAAGSKALPSGNNPQLGRDEAIALKVITPAQADVLYKDPSSKIGLNELRLGVIADMANTKKGTLALGRNKLEQQQIDGLIKGISDAQATNATPMGQQANKLNNVIHARQLLTQAYNPDTQEYDLSKAASSEAIMGIARAISPSGQLSEKVQEELSSPTAYGRVKALMQYWTGAPVNANPQAITAMYRDMLDRQGVISQDLFNAHASRELGKGMLLKQTNPLAYAAVLQNSFGTHDYRAMVQNGEDGAVSKIPGPINLGGRGEMPPPVAPQQPTAAPVAPQVASVAPAVKPVVPATNNKVRKALPGLVIH